MDLSCSQPLRGGGEAGDFPPSAESLAHLLAVRGGRQPMPSRSKVLGDRPIGGEESLRVSWRLEALHAPLALARRLMGVLGSIIEIAVLPMFHARQQLSLGGSITLQLIRDDDPWSVLASFEELAEEFLRGLLVPPALPQDIKDMAVLIDSPPEIVPGPMDGETHLVQMPLVAGSGTSALER
jgi:hypothetical protein